MTLVNALGNGLFVTVSTLFFIRSVGLTVSQVGVGMAVGGVCGIVAGFPMGKLSDRYGARRVVVCLLLLEAVLIVGYTQVHSFGMFVAVACVVTFLDRGASAVRSALIGQALPAESRVHGRAYIRSMTNIGMGVGAAIAGIALHFDTPSAYRAMVFADALTFLAAALLLLRIPTSSGAAAHAQSPEDRRKPLRDFRYLLVTLLNAVLTLQMGILQVGFPVWVAYHTDAPRIIISAAFFVNTALVVLLQVRASRGTEDPLRAARACFIAGLLLAAACVAYGVMGHLGVASAAAVAIAATIALTWGEMLSAAGGWSLSYELSDEQSIGAYQGIYNSGFAAGLLFAPLVITQTALRFGMAGWAGLGALFLVSGLMLIPATRWALAHQA